MQIILRHRMYENILCVYVNYMQTETSWWVFSYIWRWIRNDNGFHCG